MAESLEFFKLTPELVEVILRYQQGRCAICGTPFKTRRNIDHDHKTGEVRGILCHMCNRALGLFRDKLELLLKAAEFVRNPPARHALNGPHFGNVGRVKKPSRGRRKAAASATSGCSAKRLVSKGDV